MHAGVCINQHSSRILVYSLSLTGWRYSKREWSRTWQAAPYYISVWMGVMPAMVIVQKSLMYLCQIRSPSCTYVRYCHMCQWSQQSLWKRATWSWTLPAPHSPMLGVYMCHKMMLNKMDLAIYIIILLCHCDACTWLVWCLVIVIGLLAWINV